MPSRQIILSILFFFLIIGLIVCFVSYQVASWLLEPRGGGGGGNEQTVIVRSINAAENNITLQDVSGLTRLNYSDSTPFQRQGGAAASENDIVQCSTLSVSGNLNGTTIDANRITILNINQLSEGQQVANITDPRAELRDIPDPRVQVLSFLPQGTQVSLRGHCSTWIAVIAPDGRRG